MLQPACEQTSKQVGSSSAARKAASKQHRSRQAANKSSHKQPTTQAGTKQPATAPSTGRFALRNTPSHTGPSRTHFSVLVLTNGTLTSAPLRLSAAAAAAVLASICCPADAADADTDARAWAWAFTGCGLGWDLLELVALVAEREPEEDADEVWSRREKAVLAPGRVPAAGVVVRDAPGVDVGVHVCEVVCRWVGQKEREHVWGVRCIHGVHERGCGVGLGWVGEVSCLQSSLEELPVVAAPRLAGQALSTGAAIAASYGIPGWPDTKI